jgi:hypothetical protein
MSAPIFHLDGYVIRPMTEQDRHYLDSLIEEDAYHMGRMTGDYFLKLVPGEDSWAFEDEHGHVIFYFKTQTACRVSIQFGPSEKPEDRTRNRDALIKGMAWLESQLQQNAFREILFDNDGPMLKAMAKRRLGFRESQTELIRAIPPRAISRSVETPWHSAPQQARKEG